MYITHMHHTTHTQCHASSSLREELARRLTLALVRADAQVLDLECGDEAHLLAAVQVDVDDLLRGVAQQPLVRDARDGLWEA